MTRNPCDRAIAAPAATEGLVSERRALCRSDRRSVDGGNGRDDTQSSTSADASADAAMAPVEASVGWRRGTAPIVARLSERAPRIKHSALGRHREHDGCTAANAEPRLRANSCRFRSYAPTVRFRLASPR
jgi:hypothetical protein